MTNFSFFFGLAFFSIGIFADDESGEKSVSVLLNGEESELTFIDHSTAEMSVSVNKFVHALGLTPALRPSQSGNETKIKQIGVIISERCKQKKHHNNDENNDDDNKACLSC